MGKSKVFLFGVLMGGIISGAAHGSNVMIPDEQFDRLMRAFQELTIRINRESVVPAKEGEPTEAVLLKKKKKHWRKRQKKGK